MSHTSFLLSAAIMALSASVVTARPNILFIAVDDMRPEMACYGAESAITPNIDRLAAQGMRFDRAYVCYPLCNPSRTALISGQRVAPFCLPPEAGKSYANVLKLTDPLPKTLKNGGYYTAVYGKFYHGRAGLYDVSHWDVPGPMRVDGVKEWSPRIAKAIVASGGRKDHLRMYLDEQGKEAGAALIWAALDGPDTMLSDGLTAKKTIEVIKNRPKGKPFFIAAGFIRPHLPWIAPKTYFDMYPEDVGELAVTPPGRRTLQTGDSKRGGPTGNGLWNEGVSDAQARMLIRAYLASATYADAQIGKLLATLEAEGLSDNTIVVVWGDHGYHLTEHGLWRKNSPWHIALRCPLIIKAPGMAAGKSTDAVVESVDVYPTLVELTGVPVASGMRLDGESLVPLLKDPTTKIPGEALVAARGVHGLVTDRYRFMMSKHTGYTELYDLKEDPGEWHNLADAPAHQARIATFKKKVLAGWRWNEALFDRWH